MTPENDPAQGAQRDDDLAWEEIVANFGERVEVEPDAPTPVSPVVFTHSIAGFEVLEAPDEDEGHYVPPPPPAIPTPEPRRALAWAGLFGSPLVALIALLVQYPLPGWVNGFLFLAFVGGFGYLIATMDRGQDRDGWDDGAVV